MLMSAGLSLPRQVFGHGFVLFKGQKMSKSLGTVLDPLQAAERFGPDPLRLYLVKEIAYGQDGDFSWERFEERYNVDLANNLGNLVNRVAVMAHRYRSGELPAVSGTPGRLAAAATAAVAQYRQAMDTFALHEGAAAAFRLVDATNQYIAETEPWALARQPDRQEQLIQVLGDAAEAVRLIAVMLLPIMPASSRGILLRIGETRDAGTLRLDTDGVWTGGRPRRIAAADPLWPRLGEKEPTPMTTDQPGHAAAPPPAPATTQQPQPQPPAPAPVPEAGDDANLHRRVHADRYAGGPSARCRARGELAEAHQDGGRFGSEQRTLVAGIAEAYTPESLVGRTVVVVANLKPAKLMGIESNGMVLAASPEGGKPIVVGFDEAPPWGAGCGRFRNQHLS